MGEREVDRIIEQWRMSAGSSDEGAGAPGRWWRRTRWRAVAAVVVGTLCLGLVVVPLVVGGADGSRVAADRPPSPVLAAGPTPDAPAVSDPVVPDQPPKPTAPASGPQSPLHSPVDDWFQIVERVDEVRARAYRTADSGVLAEAFAPGSPALAREQELVAALADEGAAVLGWRTELLAVGQVSNQPNRAELRVRDQRLDYRVRGSGGTRQIAESRPRDWLVTMQQVSGEWLVQDVVVDLTTQRGLP